MNKTTIQPSAWLKTSDSKNLTLHCPGDKSLTHRAIIFASMAKGQSIIRSPLLGADCVSTINVFRALGVQIKFHDENRSEPYVIVDSKGVEGWRSPTTVLDFGNSGTTARLLIGLFSAVPGLKVRCIGDESLSRRPMRRVVDLLRHMGAKISGEENGNFLPIEILGQELKSMHHNFDKSSAQVKSAVLLAGLLAGGKTSITLPAGGRDHTEKFLQKMGAKVKTENQKNLETVSITGPFAIAPFDVTIPSDPSSAAFFACLGCLLPVNSQLKIPDVLNNPTRIGFVQVLRDMGAEFTVTSSVAGAANQQKNFMEPVFTLNIHSGKPLRAAAVREAAIPTLVDEVPILAVLATLANGTSTFDALHELRVKESDRLAATAELIGMMGAKVVVDGDDLSIGGQGRQHKFKGFTYDARLDHRLAMAAAIAAKFAETPSTILNYDCVEVSFPGFYEMLERTCSQ